LGRRISLIPFNHGKNYAGNTANLEKSLHEYEIINPAAMEQILELNEKTVAQLKKITFYDFDIFDLR